MNLFIERFFKHFKGRILFDAMNNYSLAKHFLPRNVIVSVCLKVP